MQIYLILQCKEYNSCYNCLTLGITLNVLKKSILNLCKYIILYLNEICYNFAQYCYLYLHSLKIYNSIYT